MERKKRSGKCRCGNNFAPNKRFCTSCHSAYMREWRKTHKVSDEQKLKGIVRSTTKMLVRRGKLQKLPCEVCGSEYVEAHHDDYSRPDKVRWLCFTHHREHHKREKLLCL